MNKTAAILTALLLAFLGAQEAQAKEDITTDILIVCGTESGWAAAIQAARMGVKLITIVHDGEWLGGQYTEQALACVDENMGGAEHGVRPLPCRVRSLKSLYGTVLGAREWWSGLTP